MFEQNVGRRRTLGQENVGRGRRLGEGEGWKMANVERGRNSEKRAVYKKNELSKVLRIRGPEMLGGRGEKLSGRVLVDREERLGLRTGRG